MRNFLFVILLLVSQAVVSQETKKITIGAGAAGGSTDITSYLKSLPGWINDGAISLRGNLTWASTGTTAPTTVSAPNLLTRSHNYSVAPYSGANMSIDYGTAVNGGVLAPDGTDDVTRIAMGDQYSSIRYGPSAATGTYTAGQTYTYWIDFKAGSMSVLHLSFNAGVAGNDKIMICDFNAATATFTKAVEDIPFTASISSLGSGAYLGWYRAVMTFTAPVGTGDIDFYSGGVMQTAGDYLYLWRSQLSQSTTPATYIATPTLP